MQSPRAGAFRSPSAFTVPSLLGSLLLFGCAATQDGARGEPAGVFGVWEAADGSAVLSIGPERVVWRRGEETAYHLARVGDGALDLFFYGSYDRVPVELTAEGLSVGGDPAVLYGPSSLDAEALELQPLQLGEAVALDAARRDALVQELVERGERDQGVREELQSDPSQEVIHRMVSIDRENTARMVELLGEVGWIDPERFGDEAAQAAFLMVQHSGDLALMSAALPWVEAEWRAGRVPGSHYALMHDRLELALGRPQVYGSQIFGLEGQPSVVAPLVDPAGVDERRAEVELQPLADYLEYFADDGGPPALFDWGTAPERTPPPARE